jgi:heptaprenyl diphosphate synthase
MAPALVFNPSPYLRALQFFFFWFLAWLSGKKNNPLLTILVILGIILFNLLVPYGRVLFSIGAFRITGGALLAGIQRGVTLEGLIMLSRASIRRDLHLPGAFGELIGESFRIFALIQERQFTITGKNFIETIDNLMIELSEAQEESRDTGAAAPESAAINDAPSLRRRSLPGLLILAAVIILTWLPWALPWVLS